MEEHILLLHIGMPKTGTTALQKFLYNNAQELKKYGWCYPGMAEKNGRCFYSPVIYEERTEIIETNVDTWSWVEMLDVQSRNWIQLWISLKRELEKYNVILSAEEMFMCDTERLLREVKREYSNVKVIVYLRRQDLYLESFWNQSVKGEMFEDRNFKDSIEGKTVHYLDKLNGISKIVGKDNLIVRAYEKRFFKGTRGDLFSDFFDAIGLEPDWPQFQNVNKVNNRLSGNYTEIKRICNSLRRVTSKLPFSHYCKYFVQMSESLPKENIKGGYFTKEERREILEKYSQENKIIAEEFAYNGDGDFFGDGDMDMPLDFEEVSQFEEDMIRSFAMMLFSEIKMYQENLINMQKRKRKLAFFGAGANCRLLLHTYDLDVALLIDNDTAKAGMEYKGIPIVMPKDVEDWNSYLIVVTGMNTDEIEKQLESLGLSKWENFLLAREVLN